MLIDILDPSAKNTHQDKKIAVGIDLGTTHTVVAYKNEEGVNVLSFSGSDIIPSVISKERDVFVIGKNAISQSGSIHSLKRHMNDPLKVLAYDKNILELTAEFLKQIRSEVSTQLNEDVTDAVITVPAYFDDTARQATKDAAFLAGFNVLRLLNEPTAAALAYGLDTKKEGLYLIYDLGGGTFDASLLKFTKGVFQVLATGGHTTLGGDDIDHKIVKECGLEETTDNLLKAREMKHFVSKNNKDADTLTKGDLLTLSCSLIQTTLKICDQVLKDAKINVQDLSGIVLSGGSTRLYGLKDALKSHFDTPLFDDLDPDLCVARGAALQAFALTQGSDTLLLDVTPLSLGIETMGGMVEKIIDRNSPIPVQKAQDFTTYQDNQTGLKIHVLQGEREMVKDCRSLSEFILSGIPPLPAGMARVRITFALDADGVLSVSAKEIHTGISQMIEVKPSYGLTHEEVKQMLYDSHANAKDDLEQRLLQESIVQVTHLLNVVKKAIDEDRDLLTDEEYDANIMIIQNIHKAIKENDRETIERLKEDLTKKTQKFAEKRLERSIQKQLVGNIA
jgi:molecular chaperone HscA